MRKQTRELALCLDNSRTEASLIVGKVYPVVPDTRAAKDGLIRVIDESGEDYLFDGSQFAVVDFPLAVRRKILALQRPANLAMQRSSARGGRR